LKYTFNWLYGRHTYALLPLASLENGYLASESRDGTIKIVDKTNIKNGKLN
jgi:hypothetical protein